MNFNIVAFDNTNKRFFQVVFILLLRAYKKDNGTTAIYGIEFLVLAISAALLPGSYLTFTYPFNKLNGIFPVAFFAYYVIKLIVVVVRTTKKKGKKK